MTKWRGRTSAAGAALLAVLTGVGCSSSNECTAPLAQLGCAATFDQQTTTLLAGPAVTCGNAGACGAYRVWRSAPNLSGLTCVYDGSGQNLLSAATCTDVQAYCGQTSFCLNGGQQIDVDKMCNVGMLQETCVGPTQGTQRN